ncbi:MAG: hypothetical protein AB7F75_05110 [Planctomycetota bacterium]
MNEHLSIWLEGILAALAVIGCQWALGRELGRRWAGQAPTLATQWALGVAAFGLLNALELALGLGRLIPFNALALFFLINRPEESLESIRQFFGGRTPALVLIASLLLVSNAFQPLWDWDAQESYVGFAKHWAHVLAFDPEGLHHVYARRPQLVSVVYTWGLMWGNETTCQVLDLAFFMAGLGWLGQRLGMGNGRIFLSLLLASGALVTATSNGWTWTEPLLPSFPGRGGNDFLPLLLILGFIEMFRPLAPLPSILLVGALLVTRWSAIPFLFFFGLWSFISSGEPRRTVVLSLLGGLLLALPWYGACWRAHGNPFYPHDSGLFSNHPSQAILDADFSPSGMSARHVEGVNSPEALRGYAQGMGLSFLLYVLSLMIRIPPPGQALFAAAWFLGLTAMATTSQVRFQFPVLVMLGSLVVSSTPRLNGRWAWNSLLALLALAALPSLQGRLHTALRLLADARHGRDVLLEERVRLWPAARWLNTQEAGTVLWPMNPSYHCNLPGLRADNAIYLMGDEDLEGHDSMVAALRRMGVRWIVAAPPYYPPTEQGALAMMHLVARLRDQGGVRMVVRLPGSGVSPPTEILEFLPLR